MNKKKEKKVKLIDLLFMIFYDWTQSWAIKKKFESQGGEQDILKIHWGHFTLIKTTENDTATFINTVNVTKTFY